jgi:hypothetical protein
MARALTSADGLVLVTPFTVTARSLPDSATAIAWDWGSPERSTAHVVAERDGGGPRPLPGTAAGSGGVVSVLVKFVAPSPAGDAICPPVVSAEGVSSPDVVPAADDAIGVVPRPFGADEPVPASACALEEALSVVVVPVVLGEATVIAGALTSVIVEVAVLPALGALVAVAEPGTVSALMVGAVIVELVVGLETVSAGASTVGGGTGAGAGMAAAGLPIGAGAGELTYVVVVVASVDTVGAVTVGAVTVGAVFVAGASAGGVVAAAVAGARVAAGVAGAWGGGGATTGAACGSDGALGPSVVTTGACCSAPERPDAAVEPADLVGFACCDGAVV